MNISRFLFMVSKQNINVNKPKAGDLS